MSLRDLYLKNCIFRGIFAEILYLVVFEDAVFI